MSDKQTKNPHHFGDRGLVFFETQNAKYSFSDSETLLLIEVCRQLDLLETLRASVAVDGVLVETSRGARPNPLLAEIRALQLALGRLLAQLNIPTEDGDEAVISMTKARARKAAVKRWTDQ
jgi:hypothetical protein